MSDTVTCCISFEHLNIYFLRIIEDSLITRHDCLLAKAITRLAESTSTEADALPIRYNIIGELLECIHSW